MMSAEKSLEKAVEKAGISKDDIVRIVYNRIWSCIHQ